MKISGGEKRARPGGRSANVRRKVLESALALLIERGPAEFSIGAVAARAGVNETSIYRRWGTKSALALDACLDFAAERLPLPDTGSLSEDLVELLRGVVRLLQSRQGAALLAMSLAQSPEAQELRRDYWRERLGLAASLVERGAARGEIAPAVDGARLIEFLVAPLFFRTLVSLQPLEEAPLEQMVAEALAIFGAGASAM